MSISQFVIFSVAFSDLKKKIFSNPLSLSDDIFLTLLICYISIYPYPTFTKQYMNSPLHLNYASFESWVHKSNPYSLINGKSFIIFEFLQLFQETHYQKGKMETNKTGSSVSNSILRHEVTNVVIIPIFSF